MDKKNLDQIIKILKSKYPDPTTMLNYNTAFELLVATVLAAQCTDERINKITPILFKKYKDVYAMSKAKQSELEQIIHSAGFFRNKAKNIIALSKKLVENFNGEVPNTMQELVSLDGVARKTANIILSTVFKKAEGIAVDTHVKRLANRLGLSTSDDPNKIEQDLLKIVPRKDWIDFNYLFVNYGREVCNARAPKCSDCRISKFCPSKQE